jgi:uncharacterized protein (TIGR03083 family)
VVTFDVTDGKELINNVVAMNQPTQPLKPILVAHLFPKIEAMLFELLHSLAPDDWEVQTIAPKWKVKDVVSHLLDTQLRKLSMARDGCRDAHAVVHTPADLVALVDRLNEEGVSIYRRLSPQVLISLMEVASRESAEYHQSLNPFAPADVGVSWAGEHQSLNWFDTAREYTERWHHQQQIRLAVNRPGIMTPEPYHPVIDCFMRALPHGYRSMPADNGTLLQVEISGECGGTWYLYRSDELWHLIDRPAGKVASLVKVPQEIAWRIFTKGIDQRSAVAQIQIDGDSVLGCHPTRYGAGSHEIWRNAAKAVQTRISYHGSKNVL